MSKFLIDFLVKQEIIGAGVEKPFDKSTLLAAAKAVSEKFRTSCDVAKVENRLKSFKTKWTKVEKLKHLNGASWDPITKIISLRGDHYRDYVKGKIFEVYKARRGQCGGYKELSCEDRGAYRCYKDLKPRDFGEELWNAISACDYNERFSVVAFEYFLKNEIEGKVFLVRHPEMRKEWLAKFFSSLL
uniref:Myb/SANT-like domain-containing protein n=1 Tax=Ananas comosus var. bracteatus TaxID=296719 RepID=A0A6V7Q7T8_ANACO|nr:unnamed protein product [Ananas comosus var. bracteatus]